MNYVVYSISAYSITEIKKPVSFNLQVFYWIDFSYRTITCVFFHKMKC
jgi:hypothetical protein